MHSLPAESDPFPLLKPRLHGIAYRMLGSAADAEEVVQDAWLRWHAADTAAIDSAEAWLVTVTTRLAIDRLRAVQAQREHYVGTWLPEPMLSAAPEALPSPPSPEQMLERADQVSMALLMVLERLAPEARAAFVMREVFDADYAELAQVLGKSEAACRQLVHRAKAQVRETRPRFEVPPDAHRRLVQDFAAAMTAGRIEALKSLLSEEATLVSDGGGKVPSFGVPLVGAQRIAQLYYAVWRREGAQLHLRAVQLNGQWALLRFSGGRLESAQTIETDDGHRIARLHVQRNPDKLARLAAQFGA